MNMLLRIPPPVYALVLLSGCYGLNGLLSMPPNLYFPALGIILAALGMILALWAWMHFIRVRTTPLPTGEPSTLIRGGPYRFTRNPMYAGVLLVLASTAFFLGSPIYLLAPAGFFLIVDRLFIPFEETRLERLFGADYADLKQQARRWL
ncbi:MAG: isoprenylcysteine carboxylmethyltransferase family protein [Methylococcaceae bacterium]|nr:isoprenylcysteine carboxylmethyltransferase family protein [Methylococcaceae bacterium]